MEKIGTINVGTLQGIGSEYQDGVTLTVEPDALPGYPSHAIIPQKISRGLANKILEQVTVHDPPKDPMR